MATTVNKTTLPNGVRILTKKMPYFRSVSMGVWVNVGSRDESVAENGLSHFIEHMIFKGTKKRTSFNIAKEFDAIGGHTNAFTGMENTCYHAKVMDNHLETMVDILTDIFLNSVFDESEVERERMVILQEIGMLEDSPEEYVHLLAGRAYWGNDPLGRPIIGNRENISKFDAHEIKHFFRRFYQPDRIVISAAGNLEHDRFVDMVEQAFGAIRPGEILPAHVTPEGCSTVEVHHRKLEQVHLCLGTRGVAITDPRRYAFSILNTIIGGNMSSRLFQEVRERRGLAYSVYSFVVSYIDTGMFGAYAGVDPKHSRESTALIVEEMRKLQATPIDTSELQNAKEFLKGNLMLASESNDNQMVRLAQNETHFGRYIPLTEIVDNIEAVTEDEIHDLARQLFATNHFALTLHGPVDDKKGYEELLDA